MLLYEPPPTRADLHFRLFSFPVRVHPLFWIVALVLGMGGGPADPTETLLWVAVVFVSILVHELGHAFVQRHYGGHPRIMLHGFGGLAICDDCDRSTWSQIVISAAGPIAGFFLAGCVVAILAITGHLAGFRPSLLPVDWRPFDLDHLQTQGKLSVRDTLIFTMLFVNIYWGLLNLLPIYPLDGGRISRELFALGDPRRGIVYSLWLSVAAAAAVAAYGVSQNSLMMAVMFGYLAYSSYQTIRAYQQHWQ